MASESDEELHARVRNGEMSAFDTLYARYEGSLFGFIRSQIGNVADAEEVFHDVFLKALAERNATLNAPGSFRAWVYSVARNAVLNRQRTGRRHERALSQFPLADAERAVDTQLLARDLHSALDSALKRLPHALAEMYHLRSSGLSYEEISRVLDVPLGTVKSRMNQMVVTLREEMQAWTAR